MVSHWRCDKGITPEMMDDGKQMTKEDLKDYLNSKSTAGNKNFILRLEYVQEFILNHDYDCGIDYQPIYYEKVLGNIPALLRIIEIYFKIQIPDIYKEYLDKKYNVKNRSKYFTGERNTEENTYNLGMTDWRNHIPENLYDYVYEKLEPHLKLWGYDHEDKLADGGFSIPVSFRSNYLGEEVHKMAIRETKQKKG